MTKSDEMTCRELVEVITDYLEGALSDDDRRRFEEHLEDCPYCVNYLDQMRLTIATLGELREDSVSPETRAELLEAFRGWRRSA
jgi:anti-sigma factor RsiW